MPASSRCYNLSANEQKKEMKPLLKNRGFTLVEMLIVIAIISIIVTIAIPQYRGYIENAKRQSAVSVLEQFPLLLENYRAEHGRMCPDCKSPGNYFFDLEKIKKIYPEFRPQGNSTAADADLPYTYTLSIKVTTTGEETATFKAQPIKPGYPKDIPIGTYK